MITGDNLVVNLVMMKNPKIQLLAGGAGLAGALGGVMISEILPSGKMLAIRIGTCNKY